MANKLKEALGTIVDATNDWLVTRLAGIDTADFHYQTQLSLDHTGKGFGLFRQTMMEKDIGYGLIYLNPRPDDPNTFGRVFVAWLSPNLGTRDKLMATSSIDPARVIIGRGEARHKAVIGSTDDFTEDNLYTVLKEGSS